MATTDTVRDAYDALTAQWDSSDPFVATLEAGYLAEPDVEGLEALGFDVDAELEAGVLALIRQHVGASAPASDLDALLGGDLGDDEHRLVLADALEDAGRDDEADLARETRVGVVVDGGRLLPGLSGRLACDIVRDLASWGRWECVGTFVARTYGPEGDEPGDVPVSVRRGELCGCKLWDVAETPDEGTFPVGLFRTEAEAAAAARAHAVANDEAE